MNDESRDKKKFLELLSKNRLLLALVGIGVAIVAFFLPMFSMGYVLFIYGVAEHGEYTFLLSDYPNESTAATISLVSTVVVSFFVVLSILSISYALIRKRKKGVESSRFIVWCSFGLLATVVAYLLAMDYNAFESTSLTDWVGGHIYAWSIPIGMGTILFVVSSCLMLVGYTLNIKHLARLLSLVAALLICYNSILYLQRFIYYRLDWISTSPPEIIEGEILTLLLPGIILLSVAFVIALVVLVMHRRAKKREFQ